MLLIMCTLIQNNVFVDINQGTSQKTGLFTLVKRVNRPDI